MTIEWGVVTTTKAPKDQILAFVAHHLDQGASRIWLHLDDPNDPNADEFRKIDKISVILCDDDYWAGHGARPDRHQNRQGLNIQSIYAQAPLPWLAHIDTDEFLAPRQPISDTLAGLPPSQILLRMEPFEAMHDPKLADDIYTAKRFRPPLRGIERQELRQQILGTYEPILLDGMLSHRVGKCFFRTGVKRVKPRLHGAMINGERIPGPNFERKLPLLHFHAQDYNTWEQSLPFRVERGAYQFHAPLADFLRSASPEQIKDFYETTQMLTPEKCQLLRIEQRLIQTKLDLRTKVDALKAQYNLAA